MAEQRYTVLVVDDDWDFLAVVSATLSADGYRVLSAASGKEAIRLAEQDSPDLVLLDARVPTVEDGWTVLRTLRELEPTRDAAIIMVTGVRDQAVAAKCFEAGADDYLVKPFKPSQLRARVQTWLLRRAERGRAED